MDPRVDAFLDRASSWGAEMRALRKLALDAGLDEDLKWGKPCYTVGGRNVAILQGFKAQCAIMFFQGALLADPTGCLERPGKNSHAARRVLFSNVSDIASLEDTLRALLAAAIAVEESGQKVAGEREPEPLPAELVDVFGEVAGLEAAFGGLTPGRRRGYILHFSGAKKSETRRARIEKCVPRILQGLGLRD